MDLLVFAHKNEAHFSLLELRPVPTPLGGVEGLWQNETSFVLVTGEGLEKCLAQTSAVLGAYHGSIQRIVNLGVAGTLKDGFTQGQTVSIRTCYAEKSAGSMQFRSFSTADQAARVDLVSASDRVTSDERAMGLRPFAQLVDREAWAVGFAAQLFSKPFYCIKTISDKAGSQTDCLAVSQSFAEYSLRLWEFYKTFTGTALITSPQVSKAFSADGFYITRSQLHILAELGPDQISADALAEIRQVESSPKKRTSLLIERLRQKRNPLNSLVRSQLQDSLLPLRKSGWAVETDPQLESDELSLRAKIRNQSDLTNLNAGLKDFDLKTWQGQFGDV